MNELKSLNAIFDGKLFRIPDYQRGYAWQQKQLTDFWNALLNLPNDGRAHYTKEWTGRAIYERSQELLRFLSTRWNCKLSEEQIKELAFVSFVEDERQVPSALS